MQRLQCTLGRKKKAKKENQKSKYKVETEESNEKEEVKENCNIQCAVI